MKNKKAKSEPLWIVVNNIDLPRVQWIWWVIEGTLESPQEGSRSFTSLHALQENFQLRGYKAPTTAQINEVVIQARVDGKTEAILQVIPRPSVD